MHNAGHPPAELDPPTESVLAWAESAAVLDNLPRPLPSSHLPRTHNGNWHLGRLHDTADLVLLPDSAVRKLVELDTVVLDSASAQVDTVLHLPSVPACFPELVLHSSFLLADETVLPAEALPPALYILGHVGLIWHLALAAESLYSDLPHSTQPAFLLLLDHTAEAATLSAGLS